MIAMIPVQARDMFLMMNCDGCGCCSRGNHKGCPYVRIANRRVAGAFRETPLRASPAHSLREVGVRLLPSPFPSREREYFALCWCLG